MVGVRNLIRLTIGMVAKNRLVAKVPGLDYGWIKRSEIQHGDRKVNPWNGFNDHAPLVLLALDYCSSVGLAFGEFYFISARNQILPFSVFLVHHALDPARHSLSGHVLHW